MVARGYSPAQLARLSGVSVRALHHYDKLGLLVPRRQANGYRCYDDADVERLQQILLLRDTGLELTQIRALLDAPEYDPARMLRDHLKTLEARRRHLDALIANVQQTLASLEKGTAMTDEERFEGLKQEAVEKNEQAFGAEARARYGDEAVDAANQRLLRMTQGEWTDIVELEEAIKEQLRTAMATGNADGPEAAELVRMHARWLASHWPEGAYSPEAHRGMAKGYLADQRFIAYYDEACGAGATQFLHDAIAANA